MCTNLQKVLNIVLDVSVILGSQATTIQEVFRNGKLIYKRLLKCHLSGCMSESKYQFLHLLLFE